MRITVQEALAFRDSGIRVRVFLNGNEVTRDCTEADDSEGWAELLRRDPDGRAHLDHNGEVARDLFAGAVVIGIDEYEGGA